MKPERILLTITAALSLPPGVPAAEAGARQFREGMGTIAPAAVSLPAGQPSMRLESLAEGLAWYLSLDGHLTAINATAMERPADFTRTSVAFLPGLDETPPHQPRYVPGRFGIGVLIDYQTQNRLPKTIAQAYFVPNGE